MAFRQVGAASVARMVPNSENPDINTATPSAYEVVFYEDSHRQAALQKEITVAGRSFRTTIQKDDNIAVSRIYIRNIARKGASDTDHLTYGLQEAFRPYGTVAKIQLIEYTENAVTYDLAEAYIYVLPEKDSTSMPTSKALLPIDNWNGAEILCFWNPYPPCPICKGTDHLKAVCPNLKDIVCFACDQPGHYAAACAVVKDQQQRLRKGGV
ncbi:hypothetical protein DFQ27_003370 [Actinomortierella ambigua]|uniref:CCHC-type domain-containing protein n=1 Tax=Actinomortierella ambigua TaxID=1343610 RepID=A0A9P6QLA3_9FUNG|nr:hypothetical protein DFQ27_003370 [Actinomortierella ambigua]